MNADTQASCDELLLDNQVCFALHSTSLLMTKVYKPLLQALGGQVFLAVSYAAVKEVLTDAERKRIEG